jgi:hypothetical protein
MGISMAFILFFDFLGQLGLKFVMAWMGSAEFFVMAFDGFC